MRWFILLILCAWLGYAKAQVYERPSIDIERYIEQVLPLQEDDLPYEEIYEVLLSYYQSPLNLNNATSEELAQLYVLAQHQIDSLISYRNKFGALLSVYELKAVPGFDTEAVQSILPFVEVKQSKIDPRPFWQRLGQGKNNFVITRYERTLEERRGFQRSESTNTNTNSGFAGSPGKFYQRYKFSNPGDYSIGLTLEKDAGETLGFNSTQSLYLADFQSFHLQIQNRGKLDNLVIGDYQLNSNQSLIFGGGFNIGKGAETVATIGHGINMIRPYTSVGEFGFFRGAAATYKTNRLAFTGFLSNKKLDANVRVDSSSSTPIFFTSLPISGLHRTTTEIRRKHQIRETVAGGIIAYKSATGNFKSGLSLAYTKFSEPYLREPNNFNQFEFNGDQNHVGGLFFNYKWKRIFLFGQAAQSSSGGRALSGGANLHISAQLQMAVLLRKYDRDFHSFYGNAFGENTRNINEQGIYWGLKYKLNRSIWFTGYYDKFSFPWVRSRVNAPSEGHEYLIRGNYQPSRSVLVYWQIREEVKDRNLSDDPATVRTPETGTKQNFLLNMDYQLNDPISFKTRIQFSRFEINEQITTGEAIIQDVNIKYGKFKLSTRYAIFSTDDFENRQYAYERDVLYAFSVPAYQGQGIRTYLLLQYRLSRKVSLWARYARTRFTDRDEIGSGLDTIDGNTRTDVKLQALIKL
ncbi:MAG: helix-hairpin-helix domain-containing protein [Bacteroidota bacterium]